MPSIWVVGIRLPVWPGSSVIVDVDVLPGIAMLVMGRRSVIVDQSRHDHKIVHIEVLRPGLSGDRLLDEVQRPAPLIASFGPALWKLKPDWPRVQIFGCVCRLWFPRRNLERNNV